MDIQRLLNLLGVRDDNNGYVMREASLTPNQKRELFEYWRSGGNAFNNYRKAIDDAIDLPGNKPKAGVYDKPNGILATISEIKPDDAAINRFTLKILIPAIRAANLNPKTSHILSEFIKKAPTGSSVVGEVGGGGVVPFEEVGGDEVVPFEEVGGGEVVPFEEVDRVAEEVVEGWKMIKKSIEGTKRLAKNFGNLIYQIINLILGIVSGMNAIATLKILDRENPFGRITKGNIRDKIKEILLDTVTYYFRFLFLLTKFPFYTENFLSMKTGSNIITSLIFILIIVFIFREFGLIGKIILEFFTYPIGCLLLCFTNQTLIDHINEAIDCMMQVLDVVALIELFNRMKYLIENINSIPDRLNHLNQGQQRIEQGQQRIEQAQDMQSAQIGQLSLAQTLIGSEVSQIAMLTPLILNKLETDLIPRLEELQIELRRMLGPVILQLEEGFQGISTQLTLGLDELKAKDTLTCPMTWDRESMLRLQDTIEGTLERSRLREFTPEQIVQLRELLEDQTSITALMSLTNLRGYAGDYATSTLLKLTYQLATLFDNSRQRSITDRGGAKKSRKARKAKRSRKSRKARKARKAKRSRRSRKSRKSRKTKKDKKKYKK